MQPLLKTVAALGLMLGLGLMSAPDAVSKAHDQGSTSDPGSNVGSETVGDAQGLGSAASGGEGQGPGDSPTGDSPGNSGDAGK